MLPAHTQEAGAPKSEPVEYPADIPKTAQPDRSDGCSIKEKGKIRPGP